MPISFSFERPAASQTNTFMDDFDIGFPAVQPPADDLTAFEARVVITGLVIDTEAIVDLSVSPITYASGGTVITGIAGDFSSVREGDVITSTSGTDFASGQAVVSVATDGSSVTFAPVSDGNTDSGSGAATLTFTPPAVDATAYIVRFKHTVSGNSVTVVPTIYCMDGTQVKEGSVVDGDDNAVIGDAATTKTLPSFTINLDSYLTNARVARV